MRFLIVEDDAVLRDMLTRSLSEAGHRVDAAATCAEAESFWTLQPYDAIVLDLNLPDGSGLTTLRSARRRGDATPVLVLTARNRTDERIAGLDAGADDYVGKPFELSEVEARLRALVRRSQGGNDRVEVGQLVLDRAARRFFIGDVPLDLPAREFEVLWELASKPGRVISKRLLSDKLSGFDDALGDNALEAFISRLRRKLQGSGATIRTLRGLGYLLEVES
jgi:two-component system, OmpR family, response regulator